MAVGSADAAEIAQVQRIARLMPPRENCSFGCGGCAGVIRRRCKGEKLNAKTQGSKGAKKEEKKGFDIDTILAQKFGFDGSSFQTEAV